MIKTCLFQYTMHPTLAPAARSALLVALLAVAGDAVAVRAPESGSTAGPRNACTGVPCPADNDLDGIPDDRDDCPLTERGAPVTVRGCEHDSDGDGLPDWRDRCPSVAVNAPIDAQGCALEAEMPLRGVVFRKNSSRLGSLDRRALQPAVDTLLMHPALRAEVAGYTDSSGSAEANLALSRKRAEAVRQHLVASGVTAGRLTARGYGEQRPIASNRTEAGRARNRRVTLRFLNLDEVDSPQ